MSTGTTLYYPYIHPRQSGNLKAALLYWDRIRRIVPASVTHGEYVQGDRPDAQLLVENGLLLSTDPAPYERAAAERFFAHLEGKDSRFQVDRRLATELARRNEGIHIEKLGYRILDELHKRGLAQRFGDWVYLHREVGAFYMHCLASEMSHKINAPLVSDSPDESPVGEAMLFEPERGGEATESLFQLGIRLPSPAELEQVSMERIVDFAKRRASERLAFREAVEDILSFASDLGLGDSAALEDYLASERTRIESSVRDLRASLDELDVLAIGGAAKISVPTGLGGWIAGLPLSPASSAILAATGLAVGVVVCAAETRGKLREARRSSPYHYLIGMESDLRIGRRIV